MASKKSKQEEIGPCITLRPDVRTHALIMKAAELRGQVRHGSPNVYAMSLVAAQARKDIQELAPGLLGKEGWLK